MTFHVTCARNEVVLNLPGFLQVWAEIPIFAVELLSTTNQLIK
jgi:hypothetical protein